jgi:cation:H+ antiporter
MPLTLLALAGSLALLAVGAELFVRGSVRIGQRLGVSTFAIGLTVVAFGTSTPELGTSLVASLRGQGDIAVGNVVGSNVFNIALILGATAIVCPIPVRLALVRKEVWLVVATATLPFLALFGDGRIGRLPGALMLVGLALYVARQLRAGRRDPAAETERELERELALPSAAAAPPRLAAASVSIAAGLAMLVAGSALLVESASAIARALGVSELVIGLTIVAAGTSTPELFTSLVAALRRQPDIAIGNVLGSNVFNVLGILGATCLASPQRVAPQVLRLDAPVMLAASLALLPIVGTQARISRGEGLGLCLGYAAYVGTLFLLARA